MIFGSIPNHIIYVPVDFEKQNLEDELRAAGYTLNSKTLFIWEGVTQYISSEANDSVLTYISKAANKSKIVFTYIIKSFMDGKNIHEGLKTMYTYMRKKNHPLWVFGIDPEFLPGYLEKYSLSLIEDIGSEEVKERYMTPSGLNLSIFEIERIAYAEIRR